MLFLFVLSLVCDAAIIEIVSVLPGLTPPFDTSSFLNGYARITWKYVAYIGGPTTYGLPYSMMCGIWMNSTNGTVGVLLTEGLQETFTTSNGGGTDLPENFYNTRVSGVQNAASVATPGSYITIAMQCRYNGKTSGVEGASCVSNNGAYPQNGTAQALCPSTAFVFYWAATPNTPPLSVEKLSSGSIQVTYVHDTWVEGYATQNYTLQQSLSANFTPVLNNFDYTADRYDVPANQTRTQSVVAGFVYYFRLRAFNGFKYSDWSNIVRIIAEDIPAAPVAVTASVYNASAFYISWNESNVLGRFANRNFQCATTQFGGQSRSSSDKDYIYVGVTNELVLGQTYYCSVQLENDAGLSSWGNALPLLFAVKPNPPVNLVCAVDTPTSVKIIWTPAPFSGADIIDSIVEYTDADGPPNWIPVTVGNPNASFTLKNLLTSHIYYIRVSSVNARGQGNPAVPILFFVPGRPNITFISTATDIDLNPNSITVPNTDGGQIITIDGEGFASYGAVAVTYGQNGEYVCTVISFSTIQLQCTLEPGVGENLSFTVHSGTVFSASSNTISNPITLSYPKPSIDQNSLHRPADIQPYDNPLHAYTSISELLIFTGKNFGPKQAGNDLTVTYGPTSDYSLHTCQIVDFTSTQIYCLTETATSLDPAKIRNLYFQVKVGGQIATGTDAYNYPINPVLYSATGCDESTCPINNTCDCPTHGEILLTFNGLFLTPPLAIFIDRVECGNLQFVSDTTVSCLLPEATGGLNLFVIASQSTYQSDPVSLISYALPTLFNVSGCKMINGKPTDCNRTSKTDIITVSGKNFGVQGAKVFIGGFVCATSLTSIAHSEILCSLPVGAGLDRVVSVYQAKGEFSVNQNVTIDYKLCDPGSYTTNSGLTCTLCPRGKFSSQIGQISCIDCSSGNSANITGATICTECVAGFFAPPSNKTSNIDREGDRINCTQCPNGTNSVAGASFCFETKPSDPQNVTVSVYDLTSLLLTWNEPLESIQYRNARCSTKLQDSSGGTLVVASTSPFIFGSLLAGSYYYCSVILVNNAGPSNPVFGNLTLLALRPEAPETPNITVRNQASAKIEWFSPNANGDPIQNSTVRYTSGSTSVELTVLGPSTTAIINNLSPLSTYIFEVASSNSVGQGGWSPSRTYTQSASPQISAVTSTQSILNGSHFFILGDTFGGQQISITGSNFQIFSSNISVTYGNGAYKCLVRSASNDNLVCNASAGVGANLSFVVYSGSINSDPSITTMSYPVPLITSRSLRRPGTQYVEPLPASSSTAEPVEFDGTNFGNDASKVLVTYGPSWDPTLYLCPIVNLTNTNIACVTSTTVSQNQSISRNLIFQVNVGGQIVQGIDVYNYPITPILLSATGCDQSSCTINNTCDCPTLGGVRLTFNGLFLTPPLAISIRGVACSNLQFISDTTVSCLLPEGSGGRNLLVTASQSTYQSDPVSLISYALPTLFNVSGCKMINGKPTNCNRTSKTDIITVSGKNFGVQGAKVFIGGIVCATSLTSIAHSEILCSLPVGAGLDRVVSVYQAEGEFSVNQNVTIDYKLCDPGTYSTNGGLNCSLCPRGKFSSQIGQVSCIECGSGTYATEEGASVCTECAPGFFTQPQNISLSIGDEGPFKNCTLCSKGRYSAKGAASCSGCGLHQYTLILRVGNQSSATNCSSCPPTGADCVDSVVNSLPGFWVYTVSTGEALVFSCPNKKACLGKNTCDINRLSSDVNALCGTCEPGFYEWSGRCVDCSQGSNGGLIFLFILVSWIYVIVTHYLSQGKAGSTKIFMYFIQTVLLCLGDTNWISWLSIFNFNVTSSPSPSCVAPWNGITQKLLGMLVPIICLLMLFLTMLIQRLCFIIWHGKTGENRVDSWLKFGNVVKGQVQFTTSPYLRSTIGFLIFSYNSISKTAFDFFKCIQVSEFAVVLASDPSILCTSPAYLSVRGFMIFLVIAVVIGFPLIIFVWLTWMHWYSDAELHSELNLGRFGILFESYRPQYYFWEVVVLARRSLLISFTASIGNIFRKEMFMALTISNILIFSSQVYASPFDDSMSNHAESVSLIFLSILTTILSVVDQPFSVQSVVVLSIIVYGPCLAFGVWYVWAWLEERKTTKLRQNLKQVRKSTMLEEGPTSPETLERVELKPPTTGYLIAPQIDDSLSPSRIASPTIQADTPAENENQLEGVRDWLSNPDKGNPEDVVYRLEAE